MNGVKKNRTGHLLFFGITALISVVFLGVFSEGKTDVSSFKKNTTITFKSTVVYADVADTENLRRKGLSGRPFLAEGTGLWFVYQKSGTYSFWMPDMNFPIDIIWFDGNFRVVFIKENATPESYPEIFTPDIPAKYILEVPAGFVKKNSVNLWDMVSVQNSS